MLKYTIYRILLTIPTLLGVAVLIFFMLRIVPGDIVEVKLRGDGGAVTHVGGHRGLPVGPDGEQPDGGQVPACWHRGKERPDGVPAAVGERGGGHG